MQLRMPNSTMGNMATVRMQVVPDNFVCYFHTSIYQNQIKPENNLSANFGCPNQLLDNIVKSLLNEGE